ncbi:hypothetical protein ABH14_08975 [Brevibacillus brevis]|uniref:hypothetical protein n=1 Tax=Brevibacillus brevis TaxID=1393 RepID=UPI0018FF1A5F|nr:hypothetical protein [Brevibacillus brevis]MBH0329936.1 hypothetical protein [Brevibacillus brevis]
MQLLLLAVVGTSFYFGYKTVQEYFHRADTFLGKFCVVLFSPVIALVAGAIVALSAVLGIIIYLAFPISVVAGGFFIYIGDNFYAGLCGVAFIVSALLITVIHKYC